MGGYNALYCCECGFGPWNFTVTAHCQNCGHLLCFDCTWEYVHCRDEVGTSSSRAYNFSSPPTAPTEQPTQSPPGITADRSNLPSHEALEIPNIAPISIVQDPTQNSASSSSVSQPYTQISTLAELETPHSQHTFTVVVPQPVDLGDGIGTTHPASSQSKQQWSAPSAVDDPRLKLSPEAANLLAHEQAFPTVSEQCDPSKDESATDTIISGAMGRLSLSAAKIEVDEDQGTGHPRDDWVHRTTLLHQLNIQPGTLHYRIILDTCDRVREHPPQSEDSRATQGSPATSPSTPSRSSENGTRSSTSSSKRPHQQREDSGGNEGGLKRYKTSKPTSGFEHSRALSCLFYKVNPHIYFECANFKAKNVSALGEHLRKRHVGERGHVHCEKCCLVFKTRQERSEHQPKCRSTRGPCVSKILPLERTQGVDAWQRWMKTWDTLFPDLRKPKDPWWSKDIFCEQILLSHRKRQWETGYDSSADLVTEALSEWVASPPEHLPDLQDFEFPIPGHSGNGNRNHTNRLTETSLREAPTSGAAEDPSSTEDTGEEVLGVMQADREPSLGPPVDYLENLRPDKDTSDTIADLGASGITISSPSDNTPSQNVSADTLFDSGWPWELEVQEPQIPLNYTVMDDLIDNPLLESYPHFDARGMDIWDSGSGPGEANAQSLTTDGFVDDNLAGLELGADFFTQTWEDYEYNTGD